MPDVIRHPAVLGAQQKKRDPGLRRDDDQELAAAS
jgi:hypothetical protein